MEEASTNQYSANLAGNNAGKPEEQFVRPQYNMPGILQFLQTEWAKFEMERAQWDVERAELQARVAFLHGERKGQENLKNDLVRRIKMLEYALKQERAKYHKLKYGTELNDVEYKSPYEADAKVPEDSTDSSLLNMGQVNNAAVWKQSRRLLRQYLQEIGYADTIIDVRSAKVRQLLGVQQDESVVNGGGGERPGSKRPSDGQSRRVVAKKAAGMADSVLLDVENSVMSTFDFLSGEHVVDDEDDNLSDGESDGNETADDEMEERLETKAANDTVVGVGDIMADAFSAEALAEFDYLVSEQGKGAAQFGEEWSGVDEEHIKNMKDKFKEEKKQHGKKTNVQRPTKTAGSDNAGLAAHKTASNGAELNGLDPESKRDGDSLEAALGLGELAELTVHNEAEAAGYETSTSEDSLRRTWTAKYTLRSHFDGVRALAFHPVEPVLVTASEDSTLKLWNLQKTVLAKKSASLDVEPIYTFRAHRGPVLCVAISPTGETCYSGGVDGTVRCWNLPNSNLDPYDSFDASVLQNTVGAHSDAVWGLTMHGHKMQVLTCSADGTIRLWNPSSSKLPPLQTFQVSEESGVPTSVDFVRHDGDQVVSSYTSGRVYIFDVETGKRLTSIDCSGGPDIAASQQINRVISHPTLPVTITAHDDRSIKFVDNNAGKVVHSMVAHLDAVTSLAVDPNGLYLLSGSHDCSVRLWSLDSKTCVQEITAHRKKFDEAIHDVAFHPSKPFIASAGADALSKVFV